MGRPTEGSEQRSAGRARTREQRIDGVDAFVITAGGRRALLAQPVELVDEQNARRLRPPRTLKLCEKL